MKIDGGVDNTPIAHRKSLQGMRVGGYVNDDVIGTTDATVITDTTMVYNLVADEKVLVVGLRYGIDTNSDHCHYEIGYTDAVDGGGTFTALGGHFEFSTGAAAAGSSMEQVSPPIPPCVDYGKGARSITWRVTVNDNSCSLSISWSGYRVSP